MPALPPERSSAMTDTRTPERAWTGWALIAVVLLLILGMFLLAGTFLTTP